MPSTQSVEKYPFCRNRIGYYITEMCNVERLGRNTDVSVSLCRADECIRGVDAFDRDIFREGRSSR